jgi:hypothetical protein
VALGRNQDYQRKVEPVPVRVDEQPFPFLIPSLLIAAIEALPETPISFMEKQDQLILFLKLVEVGEFILVIHLLLSDPLMLFSDEFPVRGQFLAWDVGELCMNDIPLLLS